MQAGALAAAAAAPQELETESSEYFESVLAYCESALNKYEKRAEGLRWWAYGIAVVGAIAGSVGGPVLLAAAPVANKAAIAAMSGLSGVANTAQAALTTYGLHPEQILATRQGIASNLTQIFNEYIAASKLPVNTRYAAMKAALDKARFACMVKDITKADLASIAPKILPVQNVTMAINSVYTFQPFATGTPPVQWELATGPAGMTVDAATGLVRFNTSAAGTHDVTIRAKNAAGADTTSWTITVQ
jgi:hypothetical protein